MAAGLNWYRSDVRELSFLLLEQFKLEELLGQPPYEGWSADEAKSVLQETYRFAREVLGPLNASADRTGCRLLDGHVLTPEGFRDAWKQLYENGFKSLSVSKAHGGQGAPTMLAVLVEEMLSGANPAFAMYSGLAFGAAELLLECGGPGAGEAVRGQHVQRHLGRHHVPHRAARRDGRGRGQKHRAEAARRHLQSEGHQSLHLRRGPRPRGKYYSPRPGPGGGRARRHQGPLLVYCPARARASRRDAGREQRRLGGLHRAQDGHQRLGHLRPQLRRRRRLRGGARGQHRERRHGADVSDDERRAHCRRHPGPGRRQQRLPQRPGVRQGAQARAALHPVEGPERAPGAHPRAPGRAPDALGHEGPHRGDAGAGDEARPPRGHEPRAEGQGRRAGQLPPRPSRAPHPAGEGLRLRRGLPRLRHGAPSLRRRGLPQGPPGGASRAAT